MEANYDLAGALRLTVQQFEESISGDFMAGMRCPGSPGNLFRLTGITELVPGVVMLLGEDLTGSPVRLIQHSSQVNLMLVPIHKDGGYQRQVLEKLVIEELPTPELPCASDVSDKEQ